MSISDTLELSETLAMRRARVTERLSERGVILAGAAVWLPPTKKEVTEVLESVSN